jgi:hypothetical protein
LEPRRTGAVTCVTFPRLASGFPSVLEA